MAGIGEPRRQRADDNRRGSRERPPLPEPLPHPVVDNHCHLDIRDSERDEDWLDPATALAQGAAVGVPRIVNVGCDLAGAAWAVEVAEAHVNIVAAVALHPNEAPVLKAAGELEAALQQIERHIAGSDRVRCVGETGLDYYRTGTEGRGAQHRSFAAHVELARTYDRALMIHDRDAHDDVLAILDECGVPDRTILHCFSGDADFARACLDRGAYLSFAGTVTFRNAEPLREALRVAPRDRILVETDAPYLTPMPYRGRPNASYLIPHTMRVMAEARGDDLTELCRAVERNTFVAFGGPWGESGHDSGNA